MNFDLTDVAEPNTGFCGAQTMDEYIEELRDEIDNLRARVISLEDELSAVNQDSSRLRHVAHSLVDAVRDLL